MLRSMWLGLLRQAIAGLMGKDWTAVVNVVQDLMLQPWTGEQKRDMALKLLRELCEEGGTWLLSAAIEIAYGQLRSRR